MTIAGRVEAQFTVPAGQSLSATNSGGGPTAVSITSGTYFPGDFVTHLQTRLNAVRTPATWTVTLDALTGLVTFNWTGAGTYSVSFASAALTMAQIGFTASFAGVTQGVATVGAQQHKGMWIPDCPLVADLDIRQAPIETDQRDVETPTGDVISLVGINRYVHTNLQWSHVAANRVWQSLETTVNQSYERFYADAIRGTGTWFLPSSPLKIYDHQGFTAGSAKPVGYWKGSGIPNPARLRMSIAKFSGWAQIDWPRIVSTG